MTLNSNNRETPHEKEIGRCGGDAAGSVPGFWAHSMARRREGMGFSSDTASGRPQHVLL